MVGANLVALKAGEMVADGNARFVVNGVAGGEALEGVIGLVVGVLELGGPAFELEVNGATECGGGVDVICDVAAGAEAGDGECAGKLVRALGK
jgi:hypothetical protein